MLIRYGYDITLSCPRPTPLVVMLAVRPERAGDAPETFEMTPALATSIYRDGFGNTCRRLVAPAGELRLRGEGTIEDSGQRDPQAREAAEVPIAELPDEALVYLLGSRYCETDRLSQIAWDRFGHVPTGWALAQAICDFVHEHITFNYQAALSMRSALDVYEVRTGVCRDFAHLAIALCRAMNMPARYATGYLSDIGGPPVDPMDYAAWIEVYLGGQWHLFDPRNNAPRIGRIKVAHGRDAADVPLIHSFGPHALESFRVWIHELKPETREAPEPAPRILEPSA